MKRKMIAIGLATLTLFMWNAISWMVLPFHGRSLQTLPDAVVEFTTLSSKHLKSGVYHYPGTPEDNTPESLNNLEQKLASGPRIPLMVYHPGGSKLFNPSDFIASLALNLITVLVIFSLLKFLPKPSLMAVLKVSFILAVLVSSCSDLLLMNWYKLPLAFTIPNMLDHLIGITLAGIIIYLLHSKALVQNNSNTTTYD